MPKFRSQSRSRIDDPNAILESFERRFGRAHVDLACHAAVPIALTPDLLYRIWYEFKQDVRGQRLNIPWEAVADVLISSFCRETGTEVFEMQAGVRRELLRRLEKDKRFGPKRV